MKAHIRIIHVHVSAALLASMVASFAYSLFVLHHEAAGHGLDITAPLMLERVFRLLHLAD